jgi:hypothetical protein
VKVGRRHRRFVVLFFWSLIIDALPADRVVILRAIDVLTTKLSRAIPDASLRSAAVSQSRGVSKRR